MSTKDHPNEATQSEQTRATEIQAGVPTPELGLPGTVLNGRYLIEKRLGQGGIGVVYLARDKQLLSRPVVIKVLLDELEGSANRAWFKKSSGRKSRRSPELIIPAWSGCLIRVRCLMARLFW